MSNSFFVRVMLIPAAVWLSVFFGGSMGSGIELIQYVTINGPIGGLIAIATIASVVGVVMYLCFELARQNNAYDYREFSKIILGKGWWLYEIVILTSMVIVIAISSTAAGTVIGKHFDLNINVGQVLLLAVVIFFTYKGREFIEKSMALASVSLLVVLVIIVGHIFFNLGEVTAANFVKDSASVAPVGVAFQYALVNISFFPLLLFGARQIKTGKESLIAAMSAAVVGVLPLLALHYAFVSHYPEIITSGADVPVYWLLETLDSAWLIDVYVVILFVLITQTGVGMMQGFVERLDSYMQKSKGKPMTPMQHSASAGFMVVLSLILSSMGIVALILAGYSFLFMSFIVVFFIPLITVGVYKLVKSKSAIIVNES
ncbi:hypothetical protein RI844_06460 [Thalassotalea fonticola]|uniref:Membrane protein YkvI n=1 Tax=Thalassotalea fonticola TaxID=3065649 RepID=A0ABZ0GT51_9GAMM|nr:hypothetical protein RI844_06460 [Colwelliaceae bacterium S1-1]